VLLVTVAACAAREPGTVVAGDLEAHGAFTFAPPTTSEAAGYFTIVNRGQVSDTLTGVTSPLAASAMVHTQVPDGGMMRMTHVEAPVVPARDSLVLAPGGTHLMLMVLDRLPRPGDSVPVTLTFARAGSMTLMLPVRPYGD
jgi:copper(I)-binding protein